MNLRFKKFEKSMRRRVRKELRASLAAWREFKRVGQRWWSRDRSLPPWFLRFVPLLIFMGIWGSWRRGMDEVVTGILFLALASTAWRAGQLLIALRSSPRLHLYAHLPLSNEQVFRLQWQYFLRTSAWSIVDFTVFYGILADRAGYGWKWLFAGLAMAIAQWLVLLSVAACFLAYARKGKLFRVAAVFAVLAFALFIHPPSASWTKPLAALAAWVPPTGWILYSMGISPAQNVLFEWWTALSFAAVLFLLPLAYQRLRKIFVVPEFVMSDERTRGAVEAWRRREADGSNTQAFGGITATIRGREFLRGFDWRRAGWVERFASTRLTPRERVTTEFMTGGSPRWTRRFIQFGLILAGGIVLAAMFPRVLAEGLPFVFLASFFFVRQTYQADCPGAALRNVNGSNISIFSAYPIGFWQIARASIKTNLARLLILAPLLIAGAGLYLSLEGRRFVLNNDILWGGKILSALVGLAFLTPIALITSGTNDGSKWRVLSLFIPGILVFIGSIVILFVASSWEAFVAGAVMVMGICFLALVIYGHAYNHNWFDLQSKPKETLKVRPQ